MQFFKRTRESLVALPLTVAAGSALAAGPDLSTITGAVDFGTVTTALLGVGAAIIVVYIAWKGAKMVISAVKGA